MRAKSLLLLIIALGCGTVASVGISQVMLDQKQGSSEPAMVEIFVAVKDIDVNQKLSTDLIKLEKWPQNRVPDGAIFKLEDIQDRYVRQRMYPGEPILTGKLNDSIVGVDTEIPKGFRVFDLSVNERNGGSGYIKPGARVDVLGTFKVNNLTESRTVMRNVRIFGINGVTVRDSDPSTTNRATTFQLLVHESQMDALNLATALGELRCTLRGTVENQDLDEGTDTGEAFITWIRGTDTRVASAANSNGSSVADIFGSPAAAAFEPPTEEKKKELLIITPNGVTKYQWSRDDELPQRVDQGAGQSSAPAGMPVATNMFSGLGGYTPMYPTTAANVGTVPGSMPPPASEATGVPEKETTSNPQTPSDSSGSTKSSVKSPARPSKTGL